MVETLRERVERHEGLRLFPYKDSRGFLTIGIGRCIEKKGISRAEAYAMLDNDIEECITDVRQLLPWAPELGDVVFDVLVEMTFQLGITGLMKFKRMLEFLERGDTISAADEMLDSDWHTQTPSRCEELAEIMRTGKLD